MPATALRQNSDAPLHSLLIAICGGCVLLPGVATGILTEKPNVESLTRDAPSFLLPRSLWFDLIYNYSVLAREFASVDLQFILAHDHMWPVGQPWDPQDPVDFRCRSRSLSPLELSSLRVDCGLFPLLSVCICVLILQIRMLDLVGSTTCLQRVATWRPLGHLVRRVDLLACLASPCFTYAACYCRDSWIFDINIL